LETKIIYIAGYGRSGSTILDIVLSNSGNGITVGEISNVFDELNNTTNKYYADKLVSTVKELNLSNEEIYNIREADKNFNKISPNYTAFWLLFFQKIKEYQDIHFFVDSSKTTWRTLFRPNNLNKSGFDVYIIFLKASYLKVWKSALKGSNKALQHSDKKNKKHYLFAVKSVFSKFLIDLFTEIFYSNKKYNLLKINYSDFINNTLKTSNKISNHFKIDFIGLDDKIIRNEFLVKGGYLGNRLRKENSIIKIKKND
jgi:hypothetical protein